MSTMRERINALHDHGKAVDLTERQQFTGVGAAAWGASHEDPGLRLGRPIRKSPEELREFPTNA